MGKLLKWGGSGCGLSFGAGCLILIAVVIVVIVIAQSVINAIIIIIATMLGANITPSTVPASIHGIPATGVVTATFHDPHYYASFGVWHIGVDIANSEGTPIYSTTDSGTVQYVGFDEDGYGYYVKLRDDASGWTMIYGHMVEMSPLSIGDIVHHGEQIGRMGSTGNSTGNHVHYELRDTGNIPTDPAGSADCCGY